MPQAFPSAVRRIGLVAAAIAFAAVSAGGAELERIALHGSEMGGEIGRRLNLEVEKNFLALDLERDFVQPFAHPQTPEVVTARFGANAIELGENLDAAVLLASSTEDSRVVRRKDWLVDAILPLQRPSGFIGVFREEPDGRQLFRNYALEECAYLIVGLADNARLYGDARSLEAARRIGDYILRCWPHRPAVRFSSIGLSLGFLSLYRATGEPRYLRFAAEAPGGGLFNDPAPLQSWRQELYPSRPLDYPGARPLTRTLPHGLYPDFPAYTYPSDRVHVYSLLERAIEQIEWQEIAGPMTDPTSPRVLRGLTDPRRPAMVVTGAAGWMEGWNQDQDGRGPLGETCASVHLLWFFEEFLRHTGEMKYGDLMERTLNNALFAAQAPEGRQLRYFTAFSGERRYFELDTYCCPGNFRRGMGTLPGMVYYRTPSGFAVNLYTSSHTVQPLPGGGNVRLEQSTNYPTSGAIDLAVTPSRPANFPILLRVPRWCAHPAVSVNGTALDLAPRDGGIELRRVWSAGDRIHLELPMEWRWVKGQGMQTGRAVLMRGPLVYGLSPVRNPGVGPDGLRDLMLDPASLGAPAPDGAARPGGTCVTVSAWRTRAENAPPGDAGRKRLDRIQGSEAAAVQAPAPLKVVFTEFTDPDCQEIYFRLPRAAAVVPDELLSAASVTGDNGIKITRDTVIGSVGGAAITLDTAVRADASTGPALPAVLMIHGGNWSKGDAHGMFTPLVPCPGLDYAEHGYFVASVGYRLSGVAKWPAQVHDCKLAIRYLRAHARELNLLPDRIGVCGFSAGAHLAGCLGAMQDVPEMEGDGGYPAVSSRVQAVVLISAPVDMTVFFTDRDGPAAGAAENAALFGSGWNSDPDLLRKASLTYYVKPGLPPFWLGTSDRDHAVSFRQVDLLADALKRANVPMEYVFVKNAVHGLIASPNAKVRGQPGPTPSPAESTAMTLEFLDRYLKAPRLK